MNSLNRDITGVPIILKERYYQGNVLERVFLPLRGGGCQKDLNGSIIHGQFMCDKMEGSVEGYEIERVATAQEVKGCTTLKREKKTKAQIRIEGNRRR